MNEMSSGYLFNFLWSLNDMEQLKSYPIFCLVYPYFFSS